MVHLEDRPGGPVRVLLVQDEADGVRALGLGAMLRAAWPRGLVLCQTQTVADAAHELADHGATCVLLDAHGAPRGRAEDQVRRLAAVAPDTPVVVLSDSADENLSVLTVRAGAQDQLDWRSLSPAALRRSLRLAIERKRSETELAQQALHDPLTGLPNRALFLDRLRGALDRSRRTGGPVTVLFLDVDQFKQINDSLGHAAGDRLLSVLADRFRALLRPMDTVARYGGDEFTFLFEGLQGEREARLVAGRISHSAGTMVTLGEHRQSISVSIGIAVVSDAALALEEVVRRADAAMYRAKQLGGDRAELYDPQGGAEPGEPGQPGRARQGAAPGGDPAQTGDPADAGGRPLASAAGEGGLEAELRGALELAQLRLHFQPHVTLAAETGLAGFEALLRWQHPRRGLLDPPQFIELAEQSGLIVEIGDWVVKEALAQAARWHKRRPSLSLSLNLSARQLADPGLSGRLRKLIVDAGHDPALVCLEVPARAIAEQPEHARGWLDELCRIGVRLAIDDIGAVMPAREALSGLPVHALKLDRRLIAAMDPEALRDAVSLAHSLGLQAVAEGIETDAQLAAARRLGCDGAQGYLFSPPMPVESIERLIAA